MAVVAVALVLFTSMRRVSMSWEIKVWHEEAGDRVRMLVEATPNVPDEVVSTVASAYWLEQVQVMAEEWDGSEPFGPAGTGQGLHG
jgi:hypothetical protein